jgi:hypothetical protein
MPFYLGKRKQGDLILFRSSNIPTKESHGHLFTAVMGPFKSKVVAHYFARYRQDNPQLCSVDEVERLARADPRMEQALFEESLSAEELAIALECDAQDQIEYSPHTIQQGDIPCPITLNICV